MFEEDQATIDNLRLWDYRPLLTTFGQQQILRRYYTFRDVDIDRYTIDDEQREIMLSARELDVELFGPNRTWTQERLVYTHGYGITAVPVQAVTPAGTPDYLVSGINREPRLPITEPRIYFGEETNTYVVTSTTTAEFDYPLDTDEGGEAGAETVWDGTTGVDLGNFFSRLLFALRFGDFNLLISGQLTDESQILFRREIEERVHEIAPFLGYDHDPYLVSSDGRLLWVWDAYTVSDRYPNAQPLGTESRFAGANYVRNSVKVVVDAYNGTVRFFLAEPDEPIAAAYARIFPDLFEPIDAMPEELRAHLRYPEDLFVAQNQAFRLYHLPATDGGATTFYNQDDRWAIPEDVTAGGDQPMEPYYVIMRIPGEDAAEFVLIQPMVPEGRPNMIAWVAARMDPGVYGERIAFQFPTGTTTQGPVQIEARINADDAISEQFTLWSNAGSQVVRGNLLVLPIGEDALLYVEPIFLQAQGAPFPEFVRVIMADQNRVAFAETVEEGLAQVLGEAEPPPPEEPEPSPSPGESPEPSPSPGELPADFDGLVAEAQRLYEEAQEALADGDLGTYQQRIDELAEVLDALEELAGRHAAAPSASPCDGCSRARIRRPRARVGLAAGARRGRAFCTKRPGQRRDGGSRRERRPRPHGSGSCRSPCQSRALRPDRDRSRGSAGGRGCRPARVDADPDLRADARRGAPGVEQGVREAPDGARGGADGGIGDFTDPDAALAHLRAAERPPVVKADWLAAGKGVVVPETLDEAETAIRDLFAGVANGARVVLEERLDGTEVSVFALVSDETVVPLAAARDYKRLADGDAGPNTGGMGAFAPVPWFGADALERAAGEIFEPIAWRMARDGAPYRGVLYAGLMLTADGPMVLEFNARFGDPEAQVLLPLIDGELSAALLGTAVGDRALMEDSVRQPTGAAVGVVVASEGYPDSPLTGRPLEGATPSPADDGGVLFFHAGTRRRPDGAFETTGGRVVTVVGPRRDHRRRARERPTGPSRRSSSRGGGPDRRRGSYMSTIGRSSATEAG